MHIAQIGTGRVGRPTTYTLLCVDARASGTTEEEKQNRRRAVLHR